MQTMTKEALKELLVNGEEISVLQTLIDIDEENTNEYVTLVSTIKRLKREQHLNIITREDYTTEWNQAVFAISNYIDNIPEEKLLDYKKSQTKNTSSENKDTSTIQKMFIYIVTFNSDGIKNKITSELFDKVSNRYGNNSKDWIPFYKDGAKDNLSISDLLNQFEKSHNFNFDARYLDRLVTVEEIEEIKRHMKESIAIIDLLSLDGDNEKLCIKVFDDKTMAGTFLPACKWLDKAVLEYMGNKRKEIFTTGEYHLQYTDCEFYEPDVNENRIFLRSLRRRFVKRFPRKNKIEGLVSNVKPSYFS